MRGESHRRLGRYLAEKYLADAPDICVEAFLFGCIQPDRNPATYLKGSLRGQWLRGHNYRNARRFIRRISRRLEQKDNWSLADYYTLGKLIHYTADAFTCAHNDWFPENLREHQKYEQALQDYFLEYLQTGPEEDVQLACSVMEAIASCHREYRLCCGTVHTDASFALRACCRVFLILLAKPIF